MPGAAGTPAAPASPGMAVISHTWRVPECCLGAWVAHAGQPQSFQQQQPAQPGPIKPFKSEINISPDLVINQNDKSLRVNGGTVSLFGTKIALPALPFALPATPALNTIQQIYPGERPPHSVCAHARRRAHSGAWKEGAQINDAHHTSRLNACAPCLLLLGRHWCAPKGLAAVLPLPLSQRACRRPVGGQARRQTLRKP